MGEGTIRKSYWLSAEDLDLRGRWKIECDGYIKGLTQGGIKLSDHMDKLLWIHNPNNGAVTASITYDLIVSSAVLLDRKFAMPKIWAYTVPLKIKCFIWLAVENRISTWEKLARKGWLGPNRCSLCKGEEEFVKHLFIVCSYTLHIFNCKIKRFNMMISWSTFLSWLIWRSGSLLIR